jgi:hypothetical protein
VRGQSGNWLFYLDFIFAEALLCMTVTPLLTPVLYMLTSTMMYVSYKGIFEVSK